MGDRLAVFQIHPADNVAVALESLAAGDRVSVGGGTLVIRDAILRGHKVAVATIGRGELVVKYGGAIGEATADIAAGEHVHVHNLRSRLRGVREYEYHAKEGACQPGRNVTEEPPSVPPWQGGKLEERQGGKLGRALAGTGGLSGLTFEGYSRADGSVGVRNEIWVVPTVGCVNGVCRRLAEEAGRSSVGEGLDGVYAFEHPYGCSQLGDDLGHTQRVLAGLVRHPNAGGVLVVGLGCENNNLAEFRKVLGAVDAERVAFLACQEVEDEFAAGMEMIGRLAGRAKADRRESVPIAKLVVGLKCGGSDGFSGITANPLLGAVSDRLTSCGATTLLAEVPEMFGAEAVLLRRCVDRDVFERCVAMINGFKAYYERHGQAIDANPSPGNREGGITTLEEKSLGCVQKGGGSPVVDVLEYGQRVRQAGLNLVSTVGNDAVSVTALTAAGAQVVLFTTGRGTPMGGPVPTVKVSTNSELARRKPRWIDFDAGRLLEGESMAACADRLLNEVIQVASGRRQTRNEENGFREIAIFKDGVTL